MFILQIGFFSDETRRRKTRTPPLVPCRTWNQLLEIGVIYSQRGAFVHLESCPKVTVLKVFGEMIPGTF